MMRREGNTGLPLSAAMLMAAVMMLGMGCASSPDAEPDPQPQPQPDPGPTVRRPDPTPVPAGRLDELAAAAAKTISSELPKERKIRTQPGRLVLAVAPAKIADKEQAATTAGLTDVLRRQLAMDKSITNKFNVINAGPDEDRVIQKRLTLPEGSKAFDDLGVKGSGAATYRPQSIYVLRVRYNSSPEMLRHEDRLAIEVTHPQSGATVYARSFRGTLVWNEDNRRWEPAQ